MITTAAENLPGAFLVASFSRGGLLSVSLYFFLRQRMELMTALPFATADVAVRRQVLLVAVDRVSFDFLDALAPGCVAVFTSEPVSGG